MALSSLFTRKQRAAPAPLGDAQQRLVGELKENGVAVAAFDELSSDASLWSELAADMAVFVEETEKLLPTLTPAEVEARFEKSFLVRRMRRKKDDPSGAVQGLSLSSPWVRFGVSPEILGVVNAYRGGPMRLVDLNNWYTIPSADAEARIASQQWHRDPWDSHILKVFTYYSDVESEDAGPFEYIRKSAPGAKYGDLWPWVENGIYPPQDELAAAIADEDYVTLTGPRGTVIFCDTAGFHRGGFARTIPRVLSYHSYISDAAQQRNAKKFEIDWSGDGASLSPEARYALE